MKLLDFFKNENNTCGSCPYNRVDPFDKSKQNGKCLWEERYPEEMAFAYSRGWVYLKAKPCIWSTEAGREFCNQLMGDFS